eukprot:TRINITY_DN24920_c0_g1_i1.p1 TRINITY_DN24920_c0_g1~~TRINITY_DN24920_c0_g1_i1.p1  ORF type:complete len:1068 (-),score=225.83 TRINITY_DN24920_c0_g1_i1:231-3347(-)
MAWKSERWEAKVRDADCRAECEGAAVVQPLEITYTRRNGQSETEEVYEELSSGRDPRGEGSCRPLERAPRLLVSVRAVTSLKELCEHEHAKHDKVAKTLSLCRSNYYKELRFLRDQLHLAYRTDAEALAKKAGLSFADFEVYWFQPPKYLDEETRELLTKLIEENMKKLIEENGELKEELAKLHTLQTGELKTVLRHLRKDGHSIPKILRSMYEILANDAERAEFADAARFVIEGRKSPDGEDDEPTRNIEEELEQLRRKSEEDDQLLGELRRRLLDSVDLELERHRADSEKGRADAERRRADLLQQRITRLERQYQDLQHELQQMTPLCTPMATPSRGRGGIMRTPSHGALYTPTHGCSTPKRGGPFCSPQSGGLLCSPNMKSLMQSPDVKAIMQSPEVKALMQSPPSCQSDTDRAVRMNRSLSKLNEAITCLTPVHNSIATPMGRHAIVGKGKMLMLDATMFGEASPQRSQRSISMDDGDCDCFDDALMRLDGLASGFDAVAQSVQRELLQLRARLRQAERLPRTDEQEDKGALSKNGSGDVGTKGAGLDKEVQTSLELLGSDNEGEQLGRSAKGSADAAAEEVAQLRRSLAAERSRADRLEQKLAEKDRLLEESQAVVEQLERRLRGCFARIDKLRGKLSSLRGGGDGGNPASDDEADDEDQPDFMVPYRKRIASAARTRPRWELLSEDAACARKRREHLSAKSIRVYSSAPAAEEIGAALTFLWQGTGGSQGLGASMSLRCAASPQVQRPNLGAAMRCAASPPIGKGLLEWGEQQDGGGASKSESIVMSPPIASAAPAHSPAPARQCFRTPMLTQLARSPVEGGLDVFAGLAADPGSSAHRRGSLTAVPSLMPSPELGAAFRRAASRQGAQSAPQKAAMSMPWEVKDSMPVRRLESSMQRAAQAGSVPCRERPGSGAAVRAASQVLGGGVSTMSGLFGGTDASLLKAEASGGQPASRPTSVGVNGVNEGSIILGARRRHIATPLTNSALARGGSATRTLSGSMSTGSFLPGASSFLASQSSRLRSSRKLSPGPS